MRLHPAFGSAIILLVCCRCVPAADLHRHGDWASAQAAARQSNKLILAYIYERGREACTAMEDMTLGRPEVVQALRSYEFLALNGDSQQSREFCEHYHVGTRWNPKEDKQDGQTAFAAVPAYLILDANGNEYYRMYGFFAPDVFLQVLGQVGKLIEYRSGLAQRPQDARLHADLGRLYLEMERPELARPLLEAAIKLDPGNDSGARASAELDLAILSIPDDPLLAARHLIAYEFNHPETNRNLEIQYYLAVAYLAGGKAEQSEKILLDFAAIPPFLPEDQAQGAQFGFLVQKGDKEVGFYPIDDLDEAKQRVRKAGEDPDKCQFTRKPMNPDYRNPWTEKADLLLRQLLKEQAGGQKPPK